MKENPDKELQFTDNIKYRCRGDDGIVRAPTNLLNYNINFRVIL